MRLRKQLRNMPLKQLSILMVILATFVEMVMFVVCLGSNELVFAVLCLVAIMINLAIIGLKCSTK